MRQVQWWDETSLECGECFGGKSTNRECQCCVHVVNCSAVAAAFGAVHVESFDVGGVRIFCLLCIALEYQHLGVEHFGTLYMYFVLIHLCYRCIFDEP
jgi:hypothetical protein